MQSLKKNWLAVSNMTFSWNFQGIWWIFTQPPKSLKLSLRRALLVQSIKVWDKNTTDEELSSFMTAYKAYKVESI